MIQAKRQNKFQGRPVISASRVVASSIAVFAGGLAGMMHGLFVMQQGYIRPDSIVVNAIGPTLRSWPGAALHALTLIPNLFVTGILAMIVGLIVAIWAGAFIERKYGCRVLLLLSMILFLVGGGFGPIPIALFACAAVTRLNKPLTWWRAHIPDRLQKILAKLWAGALITYLLAFVFAIEIAFFGILFVSLFGAEITYTILLSASYILDVILAVAILSAFARDVQRQADSAEASPALEAWAITKESA
jgi:hypothetical protein